MSVALRGNVSDFGIAEVFQLIGQQRKTGILEFSGDDEQVQLLFDRGAVVTAAPIGARPHEALGEMLVRCGLLTRQRVEKLHRECAASAQLLPRLASQRCGLDPEELEAIEDLLTRDTILRILRWDSGSFDFRAQTVEHQRSFDTLLGAEQILMDGLRMVDEWQSFAELVPSDGMVFRQTAAFERYRAGAEGEPAPQLEAARCVYRLVDGRSPVKRVVDLSRLGSFDATRALAALRRAGVIEPLDPEGTAQLLRQRPTFELSQVGAVLPALAALAVLGLAVAASWYRPPEPAAARGLAIEHAPLDSARQAHDTRGMRHALGVFHSIHGRWPTRLSELGEQGLLEPHALASGTARPYYYSSREGDALLLAPER